MSLVEITDRISLLKKQQADAKCILKFYVLGFEIARLKKFKKRIDSTLEKFYE